MEAGLSYTLSSDEILSALDYTANLLTYDELVRKNHIEDVLGPSGRCIILYETRRNFGHWCCVFRRQNGDIEFFDSYGLVPDDEIKFSKEFHKENIGDAIPHLFMMLYNYAVRTKKEIIYNHYKLQDKAPNVSTCGRWVLLRLMYAGATIGQFAKTMRSTVYRPDMLAVILTNPFVHPRIGKN
jgi:hypothetical protein